MKKSNRTIRKLKENESYYRVEYEHNGIQFYTKIAARNELEAKDYFINDLYGEWCIITNFIKLKDD